MSNGNQSILVGCLRERVSEEGGPYLSGKLGLAHVMIVKSDQKSEDGYIIWDVLVQQTLASQPDVPTAAKPEWHHPSALDYLLPDPL